MPNPPFNPRLFLIQIREREDVALHEQQCVAEQVGVSMEQIAAWNVVSSPNITLGDVSGDVVLIGGAGVHSVTNQYDFTDSLAEVVRGLVAESRPLIGLCWGHQFIAKVMGGRVETDHAHSEVGTRLVCQTKAGRRDELFAEAPLQFHAHMGHHDRVIDLPAGAIELCESDVCGNQVFRFEGKPIYGTQFHIEMTEQRLAERLEVYSAQYLADEPKLTENDERLRPTPDANCLLRRFISLSMQR